jgi:hypothetical protein
VHLARQINAALGFVAVTPWDVGDLPAEDVDDLIQLTKKRQFYAEVEAQKK